MSIKSPYRHSSFQRPASALPLHFSTAVAGTGAAIFLFLTVMVGSEKSYAQSAGRVDLRPQFEAEIPEIKANFQPGDEIAALAALDVALTQAGDGATYVWRHDFGRLGGAIQMTRTFRDADGRICRHMHMLLNSGTYSRKREGIACRQSDGGWDIDG